jgi:hypothetical protein
MNTLVKTFSPFYDFARRKLHLTWNIVDHCLDGGSANIDNRTITLRDKSGIKYVTNIGLGHRRHATAWVNDFNDRVVRVSDK